MAQRIEALKAKSVHLMSSINHLREALVWARSYNDVQFEGFPINASFIESMEETRRLVILQYTDVTNFLLQEFHVSCMRFNPPQSEVELESMVAFSNHFFGVVGGQGGGGGSGNGVVPGREGGSTDSGGWFKARSRYGLGSALAVVTAVLCVDAFAKNFSFLLGD